MPHACAIPQSPCLTISVCCFFALLCLICVLIFLFVLQLVTMLAMDVEKAVIELTEKVNSLQDPSDTSWVVVKKLEVGTRIAPCKYQAVTVTFTP